MSWRSAEESWRIPGKFLDKSWKTSRVVSEIIKDVMRIFLMENCWRNPGEVVQANLEFLKRWWV
jgi:hypothetical protein